MRFRDWLLTFVVAVFLIFAGVVSYNVFQSARRITVEGGQIVQPTALPPAPTLQQTLSAAPAAGPPTLNAAPTLTLFIPTPDPSRTTVLLLGIDEREIEEGPWRTDTMILLSLDPLRNTLSMLSIPRDLWVNIPGYEPSRINQAHFFGDASNYPGGGPALAMRTVEQTLGVPVDHYVLVNFEVFLTLMDALIKELPAGGVEICVAEEIHDERYPVPGSYDVMTVHFDAGCQLMNGEQLLQYARTRHGNSDFDRSARQQQIIRALRDEIVSFGGIQVMLGQAQSLWEAVRDGLRTDLTLDQIIALGFAAQSVPPEAIHSAVIDSNYVSFGETPDYQQVLIPNRDSVRALAQMLFNPPLSTDELARLAREREAGASVYVSNGTAVQGLAASAADNLRAGGLQVDAVQSAASVDFTESILYVRTGRWYTAWYVLDLLNLPLEAVRPGWGGIPGEWDVLVILGADYAEDKADAAPAQ
ncbi:MAG: LCP family protein [Anaerolineae bacterium]|nr:LCP family protein [Anaerolineae bacterium]